MNIIVKYSTKHESLGGVWIILIKWDNRNNLSFGEGGVTGEEDMTPVEALSL